MRRLDMFKTTANGLSVLFAVLCIMYALIAVPATLESQSFGPMIIVAVFAALAIAFRALSTNKNVDAFLKA